MIAVVGLGRWGQHHVEHLAELVGAEEVIGVDTRNERRVAVEARGIRCVSDIDALSTAVTGAVVATSKEKHAEVALKLLEREVPVLVEKPLATVPEEAWRVVEAAAAKSLPLVVGHPFLFQSAHERLREHALGLGRLHSILAQRRVPAAAAAVAEAWDDLVPNELAVAVDLGVAHDDLVGLDVERWPAAAANGLVTHLWNDDATVEIRVAAASPIRWREVWVQGEHGQAVQVEGLGFRRVGFWQSVGGGSAEAQLTWEDVDGPPPLRRELEMFLDAVENGSEARPDGVLGARVVELIARLSPYALRAIRG